MPNPTTGNESQFLRPFNILPDVIYTNPTSDTYQFQAPFITNDRPTPNSNPTTGTNTGQFDKPFDSGLSVLFTRISPVRNLNILNLSQNSDTTQWNQSSQVDQTPDQNKEYANWTPNSPSNTNAALSQGLVRLQALGAGIVSSIAGIPILTQVASAISSNADDTLSGTYRTLPFNGLSNKFLLAAVKYPDFRSSIAIDIKNSFNTPGEAAGQLGSLLDRNVNGASALLRGSIRAGIYAGATVSPAGAYSIFNRETLYGTGDHDTKFAIRADFTLRSHVAKTWAVNKWIPTVTPTEIVTPFTGDKVNVIDFSSRKLSQAYKWKPIDTSFGANIPGVGAATSDFIKFYFTGPKLHNGATGDLEDDIIVFRAHITSLSDSFNPTWTPVNMIGRADPNYIYQNYSRDLSLNFKIYATSRDEVQPIWRKLNALAGYTAPNYIDSIAMQGPWMRITLGDLFVQQPAVLNSLSYTYDMESPWEINIEDDPTMMQVPLSIEVQCSFNLITDYIPQKTGRFFSLAKKFSADAEPIRGDDNWLSDFKDNVDAKPKVKKIQETRQVGDVNNIQDRNAESSKPPPQANRTYNSSEDDRLSQYKQNNTLNNVTGG